MNPGLSVTKTQVLISFWRPRSALPTSPRCAHSFLGPHVIPSQDMRAPPAVDSGQLLPMSSGGHHGVTHTQHQHLQAGSHPQISAEGTLIH